MPNQLITRFRSLPRWQKLTCYAVFAIVLYTVVGFLVLPAVVRLVAVGQLQKHLERDVRISAIEMNPYTLSATIRDMAVMEPDGANRLASFREFHVNLQTVSLFKWAPILKEVRLDGFYAAPVLQKDRRWNFADLMPETPTTAPAPAQEPPAKEPFRFSLNNIQISGSEIHFQDDMRGKTHRITDIDIALPFLSNLPAQVDIFVNPHFNATVNGTPFKLQGQVKPFADSRETEMRLDLQGIDLAAYMPYMPPDADFQIQSGLLDIKLNLVYMTYADGSHSFNSAGNIALRSLAVADAENHPLVSLDRLSIDIGALAPLDGIVTIEEIRLKEPAFTLTRLPTEEVVRTRDAVALRDVFRNINLPPPVLKIGRFSLEDAQLTLRDLKSPAASVPAEGSMAHTMLRIPRFAVDRTRVDIDRQSVTIDTVASRDGQFEIRRLGDGQLNLDVFLGPADAAETPPTTQGEPWQIAVQTVDLAGYAVNGINLIPDDPVTVSVDQIDLDIADFSTQPGAQSSIALACRINESGRLETRTALTVTPLGADVQLDLEKVDLARFYPFIKPYIGVVLADGDLAIDGRLSLKTSEADPPAVVYKGRAAITDFKTLDRRRARPFVSWQALNLSEMDIGVNPTYLTIQDIRVKKPFSRLLIDEQGQLNLAMATVLTPEEAAQAPEGESASPTTPAAAEPDEAKPVPIVIGSIQGQGGKIIFADRSFKPGYQTTIESVETRISGLSTEATQPAKVDIKGRVDGHAPVSITGEINPLSEDMYANLAFDFQQMDLTAASPYSGRYVGRTISQGKLSVKTAYHIENRALKADHDIMIDQFNFGEDVDSPDDMNLPVDLAVALLKDRRGEIHIDLPVSGDMDDPEFSIGGIVLQAFVNLIVKAVTSPFALIGGMFEGEDLDQLEFEAGQARLTPATTEKLDALIKVLYDRPALELEISGYADPASDPPAYAEILFTRKLQGQKALQMADEGQDSVPLEDIVIAPEEFEELLQAAYAAETFEKPENIIGMEKTLPPAEAEALIRQHITVDQATLEELAYARALTVKNYLLDSGQVEAERVFLVKPADVLAPEAVEGISAGRVVLGLK